MELQHVQPGEKVTAQSYNNVVDAIFAGVNSSEGFQNTANGAVVYPRAQLITSYQSGAWRTMFQVKTAQYWKQTTRGQWNPPDKHNTVIIDLGPDADTCKSNISIMGQNVKQAGIVVGESPSMDCLLEDSVYVNASEKKTSWIDLGIDADSTDFIAADAFKCIQEEGEGDNKKQVTNYYFVVTDKSEDDVIDRAKQLFGISDEPFVRVKRFMLAKKGQVGRLDESEVYVQSHTGAISWSMPAPEMISVDSNVSSLMLSSLETLSVEYQISGLSGEMETKIGNAYSFWNFEKAERISLGEALDKEASASPGQETSCRVDVVLRVGRPDNTLSGPTEVEYLELSSLVVSCDSNFYSKEPKEMQSTSIEWTSAENGQPALQLKGFKDEESLANPPDKYSLIIREKNDDNERILKYIDPTDVLVFKVDSDISSLHRKSLEKKTDPEDADKKFVQLYNFDEPGDLVLTVDKCTKLLPEGYKLVVRHEKSGDEDNDIEVEYADLSIDVQNMSADTEVMQDESNATQSIDAAYSTQDKANFHRLHNFELNQAASKSEWEDDTENWNVLVRHKDGSNLVLDYVRIEDLSGNSLSSLSSELSTIIENTIILSAIQKADSEVPVDLSSIERVTWTDDDGKSHRAFSLYNFEADNKIALEELDKDTDALLVRTGTGQKVLQYLDLSCLSGSSAVSVDSEGETGKCSIGKNSNNELQIYNFENATTDLTAGFVNDGKLPDEIQVLVRYDNEIHYANLSVEPGGAISVDTEYSSTSESIEQQTDGVVKINGWDTKTAKSVSEVSSYSDDYDVLMRHHTNGKCQTEFINIAPLLSSGGGSAPEKRKIKKNWDWPTDTNGNYIAPGAAGATMYGYYIYGHSIQYYSGNIPPQPGNKTLLILSVEYGSGYPENQRFIWTKSYDDSSLSGIGIPLYARYNSPDGGPTYDYNAGVFTIPVYI